MSPLPPTRWGDDDDSDDDHAHTLTSQGQQGETLTIPPTHKSRIDSKGIQIVTSYRANPTNKNQLVKTVTKIKVATEQVKESRAAQLRREWKPFGVPADEKATVQSKDELFLENPHADTDLQDDDPAQAIAGNLNAFWAKQQRRQLEHKYGVGAGEDAAEESWTQVGGAGAAADGTAKYVPPGARAGAAAGSAMFKSDRRVEGDLNTLRVTNLSESTTEQDLQELFERYGRISRVYLAKDKETNRSRGFAFISFVIQAEAAKAMEELQGHGTRPFGFLYLYV
jgi:translation initiation factor 3 subunit G